MRLAALLLFVASLPAAAADDYVWWEGEAAVEHNFTNAAFPVAWFGDKAQGLSGGDWLNTGGKRGATPFRAVWRVDVPAGGRWSFHARVFWKHGPFRWRVDDGAWRECGRDRGLLDGYDLATHIVANWVSLGAVELKAGARRLEVEVLTAEGEDSPACFDCFVLTRAPFAPKGKLKPGEVYGLAADGWWAFEPTPDAFGKGALLDLRGLNERVAGERGFVGLRGDHFVDGAGKPLRFWGVNAGPALLELDEGALDYFAGRMAKLGVNLVRFHGLVADRDGDDPLAVDRRLLAKLHHLVRALKARGVYTKLSTFFPLWMRVRASDGIPGYEGQGKDHPFGLLFFDPRLQELHRAWLRALLTTPDPVTGGALATEPAVALVELVNEDSLLFWTFCKARVGAPQWAALEARFAAWAQRRHGSLEAARAAWGGERAEGDGPSSLGLYDPWHLTADGLGKSAPSKQARAKDQARFYAETMRAFYADTTRWLREELGYRGAVSASNWQTADDGTLGALERWSYTAAGVLDRHGYFGGKHEGEGAGYSVRPGHTYEDRSALLAPEELPIKVNRVAGHPHLISEIAWNRPNRLVADGMMVMAAYGALQGVDGLCHFAAGGGLWESAGGGKWALLMPGAAGQFPAAALTYRLGLVAPGETVVRQVLDAEQLWRLEGTGLGEGRSRDFRLAGLEQGDDGACDPLAFFVGRVERSLVPGARPVTRDLGGLVDRAARTLRSTTGELRWDWGRGVLAVDAPASQGVAGHLARAGDAALRTARIASSMEYGAVWVVSLDGQPLSSAKRILVQAFSEERMYGARAEGGRIVDLGQAPINVRRIVGTVSLPGRLTGTVLDAHGYPRGPATVRRAGGRTELTLPEDALYTLLTR